MTKREKILAAAVVATLLILGGFYVVDRIMNAFDQRDTEEIALRDKLATQSRVALQGKKCIFR